VTAFLRELTPAGRGAVSVLEITGSDALGWLRSRCSSELALRRLIVTRVRIADDLEDEALVWADSEERVELHLHGAPLLVRRLSEQLPAAVEPRGLEERARRAAGSALGAEAARILLDQAGGALRRALEGAAESSDPAAVDELLERGRWMRRLLVPTRVVLTGPVNAGKSTLFNAVLGSERVVVSAELGTTRDAIGERARLGPWPVELWDTAGWRELGDSPWERLEAEGQDVGRRASAAADLVVELCPADGPAGADAPEAEPPRRVLTSRADAVEPAALHGRPRPIAARSRPDEAVESLRGAFEEHFRLPRAPWRAGAAVPFEELHLEVLARARAAPDAEGRRRCLLELLGDTGR